MFKKIKTSLFSYPRQNCLKAKPEKKEEEDLSTLLQCLLWIMIKNP